MDTPGPLFIETLCIRQDRSFTERGSWNDFSCEDRQDGNYPDAGSNCAIYHMCYSGRHITFKCRPGEMYDVMSEQCQPESVAYCPPHVQVEPVKEINEDCLAREGYFADVSTECSAFYQCKDGIKTVFFCRIGLVFDEDRQACVHREYSACGEAAMERRLQTFQEHKPIVEQTRQIKFNPFYSDLRKRVSSLAFQLRKHQP